MEQFCLSSITCHINSLQFSYILMMTTTNKVKRIITILTTEIIPAIWLRNFLDGCIFFSPFFFALVDPTKIVYARVKWISSPFISKQMTCAEQICHNKSRQTLIQCLNKRNSIFRRRLQMQVVSTQLADGAIRMSTNDY